MKRIILFIIILLLNSLAYSQSEIKTVIRPDGISLKYFNPIPVVITNSHEAGLSLYKNVNNKIYTLALTVIFKSDKPTELDGNLMIQTTGINGISLKPIFHKLININGRNVASSMFQLTEKDINELKSKSIKLIIFNASGQPIGLNLTKNKNLLITEFSKL